MFYSEQLKQIDKRGKWNMIVIDGVVGVGKSTLMELLKELGYKAFEEPVVDNPFLDKFYHNRLRYSFPLQVFFLNERFKHIKEASKYKKACLDRSIFGDLLFAKLLRDNNEMSEEEFQTYLALFRNMIQHCHPPKLLIYLEISTDEAIKRIAKRGRDYEMIVEREYWNNLNTNYREYFNEFTISPVLKINVDGLDFENNEDDRDKVMGLIKEKLIELGE